MGWMGIRITILGVLFLFGAYLIGPSLTGMVVSETCCSPGSEGCTAENACSALQQPAPEPVPAIGLSLILLASLLVAGELAWERRKRELLKEERRNRRVRVV